MGLMWRMVYKVASVTAVEQRTEKTDNRGRCGKAEVLVVNTINQVMESCKVYTYTHV